MLGEITFSNDVLRQIVTPHISLFEYPKLQQVDKRWGQIVQSLYPYAAFKIIHAVSEREIGEFIKCAGLANLKSASELINTNCFYSMLAVSVIASGIEKTNLVAHRLYENYKFYSRLKVKVKNSTVFIEIKFDNLFSGPLLVDLNNNIIKKDDDNALRAKFSVIHKIFLNCINPVLLQCEHKLSDDILECRWKTAENVYQALNHIPYDFNQDTIHSLLNEIKMNIGKVAFDSSFLYNISINCPNPRRDEENTLKYSAYHAFAIEHYFSSEKNGSMFRIYQSNIRKMTLQDYMKKMHYKPFSDDGCIDYQGVLNYFEDIKCLLMKPGDEFNDLSQRCFGSLLQRQYASFYNENTKAVEGLSFRYKTESFNPKSCIKNILDFLKNQNKDSSFFSLDC